jgi:hypothetical protein
MPTDQNPSMTPITLNGKNGHTAASKSLHTIKEMIRKLRAIEVVQIRLGTHNERPGDMELVRELAHDFHNMSTIQGLGTEVLLAKLKKRGAGPGQNSRSSNEEQAQPLEAPIVR